MIMVDSLPDLVPLKPVRGELAAKAFPPVLTRAGRAACFTADEFFSARISNPETRRAYARAVGWEAERGNWDRRFDLQRITSADCSVMAAKRCEAEEAIVVARARTWTLRPPQATGPSSCAGHTVPGAERGACPSVTGCVARTSRRGERRRGTV